MPSRERGETLSRHLRSPRERRTEHAGTMTGTAPYVVAGVRQDLDRRRWVKQRLDLGGFRVQQPQ